jgi:uncharacterized protein (TIGR02594 family)
VIETALKITAFDLAQRYIGVREISGAKHHPLVVWWLSLCGLKDQPDETPWCSAFVNGIAWELRLPRSNSAAARSWLKVGVPVAPRDAVAGFDVVILRRGEGDQPGPEVTSGAPGHVGFFAGWDTPGGRVLVLGGNQGDEVSVDGFGAARILGVRRIAGVS